MQMEPCAEAGSRPKPRGVERAARALTWATNVETIAAGRGISDLPRLRRLYGKGYWRKGEPKRGDLGSSPVHPANPSLRSVLPGGRSLERHDYTSALSSLHCNAASAACSDNLGFFARLSSPCP